MVGRPCVEAGLGISASPLQCAGHDDPLQGPVEARRYQERNEEPLEAAWARRNKVLSHCCLVWIHLQGPPAPAPLRPEFTREPATLRPAAEDSGVRDGPGVGWCGAVAPQTTCFPSVLAPVLSWPRLSLRVPGSVLDPSSSEDSSRIRGVAMPPHPQQGEPRWWSATCRPLATPPQHTFSARGFGVFGFLPSRRGRGFRAHAVLALWPRPGKGPEDMVGSWPGARRVTRPPL